MDKGEIDTFKSTLKEALTFVFKRQRKEGGFSLTPGLPSTLEDTYHAFKIIEIAKNLCLDTSDFIKDAHKFYLLSKLKEIKKINNKNGYHLFYCLNFLNEKIFPSPNSLTPNSSPFILEETFYLIKIFEVLNYKPSLSMLPNRELKYDFDGIIKKRFMALYLDNTFRLNKISKELAITWVKSCQNCDGGFGFLPGTTSFIENTFWAIRALLLLKTPIKNKKIILDYIFSCKTKNGGFSRKEGAAPFLDATFYGVSVIYYLFIKDK